MNKKIMLVMVLFIMVVSAQVLAEVQIGELGAQSVVTYDGCAGKRFGIVGASNTMKYDNDGNLIRSRDALDDIIKEHCPNAEVFISSV